MYLSSLRHNAKITVQTAAGPAEQQNAAIDASISISETVPNPGAVCGEATNHLGCGRLAGLSSHNQRLEKGKAGNT